MIRFWWSFSFHLSFCVSGMMTDVLGVAITSTIRFRWFFSLHLTFCVSGLMTDCPGSGAYFHFLWSFSPSYISCVDSTVLRVVCPSTTYLMVVLSLLHLCFEHNDSIILGGACTPIIHLGQSFSCCDLLLVICLSWRWHVPLVTLPHPEHDDSTVLGVVLTPAIQHLWSLFVHLILFMFQA